MIIDDFLKKHELKKVFNTELKIEREKFIEKMKEISDISFKTKFSLIADNFLPEKIKFVGNFSRSFIELRERTFPFKRYKAESIIKLNLNSQNEILFIKTSIQGISYFRFILSALVLSILSLLCIFYLFELVFLPILLIVSISYFYLFITFKNSKTNVKKIKKELSNYYDTIEKNNCNKK